MQGIEDEPGDLDSDLPPSGNGYVERTPEDLTSELIRIVKGRLGEMPSGLFISPDRTHPWIIALQGDYIPSSSEWFGASMYLLVLPNPKQSKAGELPREIGLYPDGSNKSRFRSATDSRIDTGFEMLEKGYFLDVKRCVQHRNLGPFTVPGSREPPRHLSPRLGDPLVA